MTRHVTATVDPDVHSQLTQLADSEDRSLSSIMRRALRRELAEAEKAGQLMRDGKSRTVKRRKLAAA